MITSKPAQTDYSILPVIGNRWSPVAFSDRLVEKEKVMSLLEAARWAPSSFNEQPWQYVVGYQGDETHQKLCETLLEGNEWAKGAGVLMLSVAKAFFEHKHKPNRHAMHDLGMATMNLVLQATELNLITHQMGGFDSQKAQELFNIPTDFELGSMIAIGYPGEPISDDMKQRDEAPRERKATQALIWTN
jgi:nitroreductase